MFKRTRTAPIETITLPKAEYLALCDRASSNTARRVLGDQPLSTAPVWVTERQQRMSEPIVPAALSEAQIQLVLEAHYRQVLASKDGRKLWRKLLADCAAAERAQKIGR
jgi:hypothetical protein